MSSVPLRVAAIRIAGELAAILDTDTAWMTPEWVAAGRGPRCAAKRVRRS